MDSGNLPKAFLYIAPFVVDPGSWKQPQLTPFDETPVFVGLAAEALQSPELKAAHEKMKPPTDVWGVLADAIARLVAKEMRRQPRSSF